MSKRSGFTLLEISIVLVILGLITSGILVGQMLIRSAEIRKAIKQREEFDTAANTFRLKYNCIPGDCAEAYQLGLARDEYNTFTYGQAGNGDGMIGVLDNIGPSEQVEAPSFWYHLSQANLINWAPLNPEDMDLSVTCEPRGAGPCLAFTASSEDGRRAGWWIHSTYSGVFITNAVHAAGNYFWITGVLGMTAVTGAGVLTPVEAYEIDSKIDDGAPLNGTVLAAGDMPAPLYGPTDASLDVDSDGVSCLGNMAVPPGNYNLSSTQRTAENMCSLLFKASF